MPFLTCELHQFTIDKGTFNQTLRDKIEKESRKAATAFLRVAFPKVPYRTGFARGGFLNLMDLLNEGMPLNPAGQLTKIVRSLRRKGAKKAATDIRNIQKSIKAGRSLSTEERERLSKFSPKPKVETPLKRLLNLGRGLGVGNGRKEYYNRTVLKNAQNARQFSTPPHQIFQWKGDIFQFNYGIDISYFRINDFLNNPRTPSAPWRSFIQGTQAYNIYVNKTMAKNLPRISEFFSYSQVRVVETRVTKRKLEHSVRVNRRQLNG